MKNRKKIGFVLSGILFILVLTFAASKIRQNSFFLFFFDDDTAFIDEAGVRMNVSLEHSRQWIKALETASGELIFFLPSGCHYTRLYSFRTGDDMDLTNPESNGKPIRFLSDRSLPSLFVNTALERDQLIEDKNVETRGELQVYDPDGNCLQDAKIAFKGHGNGSWIAADKKSWLIKFDQNTSVLGMKAGKGYVAISNALDGSFLRNHMTFDMARHLNMADTPDDRFVNLYLNDEYQGLYQLATRIEVSSERMAGLSGENAILNESASSADAYKRDNLEHLETELMKGYIYPDQSSGDEKDTGVLFAQLTDHEVERYEDVDAGFIAHERALMGILFPKAASITQVEQVRDLYTGFLGAVQKALDTQNTDHPDLSYLEYIDLDSFVRKHLVEQFTKNHDANVCSSYYSIRNLQSDPIIYEGPVWDYDYAYGNWFGGADWTVPEGYLNFPPGLERLDAFMSLQDQYYSEYLRPYLDRAFPAEVNATLEQISDSARMDLVRWPDNPQRSADHKDDVDSFLRFVRGRKQFFDESILEGKTFYRVNFVSGDAITGCLYVEKGTSIAAKTGLEQTVYPDTFRDPQPDSDKQFAGWFEEDLETPADFNEPVTDDLAYYAVWK